METNVIEAVHNPSKIERIRRGVVDELREQPILRTTLFGGCPSRKQLSPNV